MGGALKDAAWGGLAGAVFGITTGILGSGLLGLLAGAIVAGSALKGPRGTAVATMCGFLFVAALFSGSSTTQASGSAEVM
jgi:ABC-type transport system involved in cytochrome bd biosynthesis fused ATPase/permease subunit